MNQEISQSIANVAGRIEDIKAKHDRDMKIRDDAIANLSSKYHTLELTLRNMTLRLRQLELDVHPECPRCGQRLPEGLKRGEVPKAVNVEYADPARGYEPATDWLKGESEMLKKTPGIHHSAGSGSSGTSSLIR